MFIIPREIFYKGDSLIIGRGYLLTSLYDPIKEQWPNFMEKYTIFYKKNILLYLLISSRWKLDIINTSKLLST